MEELKEIINQDFLTIYIDKDIKEESYRKVKEIILKSLRFYPTPFLTFELVEAWCLLVSSQDN